MNNEKNKNTNKKFKIAYAFTFIIAIAALMFCAQRRYGPGEREHTNSAWNQPRGDGKSGAPCRGTHQGHPTNLSL